MDERSDAMRWLRARSYAAYRRVMRPDNHNEEAAVAEAIATAITLVDGAPAMLTLALDADRHVRLRIACALQQRSAQAILSDALDAHLGTIAGAEPFVAGTEGGTAAISWGADR
ncbi:MAG: hypothetical protein ABW173_04890 [Sphingomonas sp.]